LIFFSYLQNWKLREHLWEIARTCIEAFSGDVSSPFFQFGLDLTWMRVVNDKGLAPARRVYTIDIASKSNPRCATEEDELARRNFLLTMKEKDGLPGYWKIQDEEQFVEKVYMHYENIYGDVSFQESQSYLPFIRNMTDILGVRWSKVPRLLQSFECQMEVVRRAKGTPDKPVTWNIPRQITGENKLGDAIRFLRSLQSLEGGPYMHKVKAIPPWWKELRELALLSTEAVQEVQCMRQECWDDTKSKYDADKIDVLVMSLIGMHDTAVYLPVVYSHLMEVRQDLLQDRHILEARTGVFNQVRKDEIAVPAYFDLTHSRKLFPRQCEVFARRLLELIHSEDVPFRQRVTAAEDYTKLPTTTIHEIATLLKEDLNPRINEALLMFLPRLDEPPSGIQFLLAPIFLDGDLARTAIFGVKRSLEYVSTTDAAAIIASTFPGEGSKRLLKVTVAKELARTICEYVELPEAQAVVRSLWHRKLHADGK
jgi:hypothetical protein